MNRTILAALLALSAATAVAGEKATDTTGKIGPTGHSAADPNRGEGQGHGRGNEEVSPAPGHSHDDHGKTEPHGDAAHPDEGKHKGYAKRDEKQKDK